MTNRLIDFSLSDFAAWNREREKHLQQIDLLKSVLEEVKDERNYWRQLAMTNARLSD